MFLCFLSSAEDNIKKSPNPFGCDFQCIQEGLGFLFQLLILFMQRIVPLLPCFCTFLRLLEFLLVLDLLCLFRNQDIVPERTSMNVHFKAPTDDYVKMFEQMEQDGVISTRGLKPDAVKYGELIFDVNSAYFYNHGGYEFAKQFYADAYKAAAEIVGGEQYILSAVMHADERNRAMSEALGKDVYHYHLHVVYIPVVKKQILWSKRCKDEALRGTVKEVIFGCPV